MKILVVHNRYQSQHMGGEDLVVSREINGLKAVLGEDQIATYQVSNDDLKPHKVIFSLWGDHTHYQAISRLVKQQHIDIVHVHNFFPQLTPLVFMAAKEAGATVIQTLHNFRWWCLSGIFYREGQEACEQCVPKRFAWPGIQHRCYRGSTWQSGIGALAFAWYRLKEYQGMIDAYFVLSEFQREKVKQWLPADKLWLKPNPIDVSVRSENIADKKDFLFVGRLEAAKGIDLLLSTWEKLPAHYVLNIIGSGPLSELSKRYGKSNIRFLGKMPHDQTLAYVRQAKYVIHPSLTYETFGLTLVEALAHSTPVIALEGGPRREFIRTGYNGWLCQPTQLEETIIKAYEEPKYSRLANNAYESAQAFFVSPIMEHQIKCYEKIRLQESARDYIDHYRVF